MVSAVERRYVYVGAQVMQYRYAGKTAEWRAQGPMENESGRWTMDEHDGPPRALR